MSDEQDWDEANLPFIGHPVVATLTGLAVIVLTAIFLPRYFPNQPLNVLLAFGAGLAVLLWVIGFAATIRRSPLLWKLGTLTVLLAAGLIGGFGAHQLEVSQANGDATTLAEVEIGPDNAPVYPRDAQARGPVSRLFVNATHQNALEDRAYGEEVGKLGVSALNSPYALGQAPAVLGHCDAIGGVKTLAKQGRDNRAARLAEILAGIDKAPLTEELKKGMRQMVYPGATQAELDAMLAADVEVLDASQALCTLLAKKTWGNQDGYFGFSSGADRAAYVAIDKRRKDAAGAVTMLQRQARDRVLAGREVVRDILDVSGR